LFSWASAHASTADWSFIMRLAPTFSFLRRSSDRAPAPRVQDPADLGTAFGFEASLEQVQPVRDNYAQLESQRPHPPLENPMAWVRRSRS